MTAARPAARRRVLALAQSAVAGDARVLREAEALATAGYEVHIIGRGVPPGFEPPAGVGVDSVGRSAGLRPGAAAPGSAPRPAQGRPGLAAARWLLLPEHRARVEGAWRAAAAGRIEAYLASGPPDVVHAHDFNTLEVAAGVADRTRAALVYDAHELWAGRAVVGRPDPVRRRRDARREDALLARADLVLTVSEGIAERLLARGARRVAVVRNSFPARPGSSPLPGRPSGLVYAGRIGPGRDLETLAAAAPALAAIGVRPVVVGPPDASYLTHYRARSAMRGRRGAGGDLDLRPVTLPLDEVDEVYRSAGLAVVTLDGSCDNHRLALPNKLFHAIRAGVPVVAADLPELARVVTEDRLGATYRPGDAASLARAVAGVVERYPDAVAAVATAQDRYRWEHDAAVLTGAYAALPVATPSGAV
ncbi:MAG TPA: glycosyltransferase [Kineosporiaceae bacterium]|nr:glycosyltransferase [Kineosporiaceae bacterium]